MPSQQHLEEKSAVVAEISEKFEKASSVVVIDYIGITVAQADAMRNKLRDAGVDYKVYKNTLVKRAIAGTDNEKMTEILDGPSAFAFGFDDAIAPARVLDGVMKETKKMSFKAGFVEGTYYDAEGIRQIALIPSRDILIGRFLGSIQSPIGKLVRTFAAIADDLGGGTAAAAAPAKEEAALAEEAVAETVSEVAMPVEEASAEAAAETVSEAATPTEEAPAAETAVEAAETVAEEAAPVEETVAETVSEAAAPAEEAVEEAAAEEAAPAEEAEE